MATRTMPDVVSDSLAAAEELARSAREAAKSPPASGPPSRIGIIAAAALIAVALIVSLLPWGDETGFMPTSDFKLFAGFYIVAQALERLLEVFARVFVPGNTATDKGDRAIVLGGISVVAAVIASKALGLYFLAAVGVDDPHRGVDAFVTGLLVGGGTKALHDLILRIEKGKERAAASAISTAAEGAVGTAAAADRLTQR
jgi:hypothetical protein